MNECLKAASAQFQRYWAVFSVHIGTIRHSCQERIMQFLFVDWIVRSASCGEFELRPATMNLKLLATTMEPLFLESRAMFL